MMKSNISSYKVKCNKCGFETENQFAEVRHSEHCLMSLRFHDEDYFEKWHQHDNVEGLDFPYLCQKCNHFLSKDAVNWCNHSYLIPSTIIKSASPREKCAGITNGNAE